MYVCMCGCVCVCACVCARVCVCNLRDRLVFGALFEKFDHLLERQQIGLVNVSGGDGKKQKGAFITSGHLKTEQYACVCMYVCMYVYMHVCIFVCLSVRLSVCLSVCLYVHTSTNMFPYKYIHIIPVFASSAH